MLRDIKILSDAQDVPGLLSFLGAYLVPDRDQVRVGRDCLVALMVWGPGRFEHGCMRAAQLYYQLGTQCIRMHQVSLMVQTPADHPAPHPCCCCAYVCLSVRWRSCWSTWMAVHSQTCSKR